jgi:hypothetical protein
VHNLWIFYPDKDGSGLFRSDDKQPIKKDPGTGSYRGSGKISGYSVVPVYDISIFFPSSQECFT